MLAHLTVENEFENNLSSVICWKASCVAFLQGRIPNLKCSMKRILKNYQQSYTEKSKMNKCKNPYTLKKIHHEIKPTSSKDTVTVRASRITLAKKMEICNIHQFMSQSTSLNKIINIIIHSKPTARTIIIIIIISSSSSSTATNSASSSSSST